MDKKWPFGFFVYSSIGEKDEAAQAEPEKTEEAVTEPVKVVWAETPASVVLEEEPLPAEETVSEEVKVEAEDEDFEDEEDEDLPDFEEELEIALEAAHQRGVKKQRIVTGISAGVALLGAVGLATGLAIHNHFKKKQN